MDAIPVNSVICAATRPSPFGESWIHSYVYMLTIISRNCLKNGGTCGYRGPDSAESSTVNSPTADSGPVLLSHPPSNNLVDVADETIFCAQTYNVLEHPDLCLTQCRSPSYEQFPQLSTGELLGGPRASHLEDLPIALCPESRMLLSHRKLSSHFVSQLQIHHPRPRPVRNGLR